MSTQAKNMIEAAQKTQKEQFTALSALMKRHEGLDEGLSAVRAWDDSARTDTKSCKKSLLERLGSQVQI